MHENGSKNEKELIYVSGDDYVIAIPKTAVYREVLIQALQELYDERKPYDVSVVIDDFDRPDTYFCLIFIRSELEGIVYFSEIEPGLSASVDVVLPRIPGQSVFGIFTKIFDFFSKRFGVHTFWFIARDDWAHVVPSAVAFGFVPLVTLVKQPPRRVLFVYWSAPSKYDAPSEVNAYALPSNVM